MEKTTLEIGNIQNILLILGNLYSPVDAASEYFANSMDAHAKNIEISYGKDAKGSYLAFSDDGDGMNIDDLKRVAKNIGNSIKKIETTSDAIGQFGIGILGFVTFGNEMHIISKKKPEELISELVVKKGSIECIIETSKRKNLRITKEHGTDIYVYYVEKIPIRADVLVSHISQKYRHLLLKNPVNAIVKSKRTYEIKAFLISGVVIHKHLYKTHFGNLTVHLYLSHEERNCIPIKIIRKGVVICNLTDIDDFNRSPWNNGKLTGDIIFDAIEITSDRKTLLQNNREFEVFKEKLLEVEKIVESYLEEQKKKKFDSIDREIKKHLNEVITKALSSLTDPLELFDRKLPSSEKYTMPLAQNNEKVPGFLQIEEELYKERKDERKFEKKEIPSKNPPQISNEMITLDDFDVKSIEKLPPVFKPKNKPGINWEFSSDYFQDEPWKMSIYDTKLNIIYINDSHPYWQNIKNSDEEIFHDLRMDYLLALTLKEIVLHNLKGESRLLEKLFEKNMEMYIRFMIKTRELTLKSVLMR